MLSFIPILTLAAQTGPTPNLVSLTQVRIEEYKKVQNVRDKILAADPYAGLVPDALDRDADIKAMGLDGESGKQQVAIALGYEFDPGVMADLKPLDLTSNDPMIDYTIERTDPSGTPVFKSMRSGLKDLALGVYKVKVTRLTPPADPKTPPAKEVFEVYVGIIDKEDLANTLAFDTAHAPKGGPQITTDIEDDSGIPLHLYVNSHKQVFAVLDHEPSQPILFPERPEFVIFNKPADAVQAAYKNKSQGTIGSQEISWAVKEPEGIVSMEHVRRAAYLKLQKLKDTVKAQHPTEADFPPEMLQTDEFKATGLNLNSRQDQSLFLQALTYTPEGQSLTGYHPIDFTKDRAAADTAITPAGPKQFSVNTFKNTFEGKKVFLYKIKANHKKPDGSETSTEAYIGPFTPDTLAAIKKATTDVQITEEKDQDVPLNIYTNSVGSVVFVMAFRPKDLLLVPIQPTMLLTTDTIEQCKPIADKPEEAGPLVQRMPKLFTSYGILES
ncbi:MAG TPA: hypothetical protein VGL56_03625 [Fimbriimonadaceae bacterium]|jgi:hypothetical protein